jgi:hypothetical protein
MGLLLTPKVGMMVGSAGGGLFHTVQLIVRAERETSSEIKAITMETQSLIEI